MKRKRHSPEQIIRKLRDADRMLSEGKEIAAVCQALAPSEFAKEGQKPMTEGHPDFLVTTGIEMGSGSM